MYVYTSNPPPILHTFRGDVGPLCPFCGQKNVKVGNLHKMQKRSYPPSFTPIGRKVRFYYILGDFGPLCPILGSKNVKVGNLGLPIFIKCKNAPTHQVSAQSDEN